MKLDGKRTVLVGLAFLSICAFWQLYDFVIPLVLKDTFRIDDYWTGWVMALDNILALFLLPLFGRFSDRCDTRIGRRVPFVIGGTIAAVVLLNLVPLANNAGMKIVLDVFTGKADASLLGAPLHGRFLLFFGILALILIAMGTYRSPAVALMPDVTPKPLRSRANAVINLMGAVGGILTMGATTFFARTKVVEILPEFAKNGETALSYTDFGPVFALVAGVMVISVAALALSVRERALRLPPEREELLGTAQKLPAGMKRSLGLILISVFFWFMGYNAVTTAYSKYFVAMWGGVNRAALCNMIAMAGAVVAYIPVGILSTKFGRKRMILAGVVLLAVCFAATAFISKFSLAIYVLFVLVGFAWAAINVNSYPMVVEISRASDVGKYTGFYYTFSMSAQILTPILSGFLLKTVGYHTLFPYAAGMVAVSFFTMLAVRHGDTRPEKVERLIDRFAGDD